MAEEAKARKRGPGRPPYAPTEKEHHQVQTLAAMGARMDDIAQVMQLDPKTLRKHFADALKTGRTKANLRVATTLFEKAVHEGHFGALKWWTQVQMGWAPPGEVDPIREFEKLNRIQQNVFFLAQGFTDEEIENARRRLAFWEEENGEAERD